MEEFAADAVVEADAARDLLDVGAHLLAEVGDFVDEGDLGRKECVGGVLYEFGGAPRGVENGRLIEAQRPVDIGQDVFGALVLGADHDAIGMLEIVNGRSLPQKFRVRHHHDIGVRPLLVDDALDFIAGTDRYGRLGNDDCKSVERGGDLAGRIVNVGKIRIPIAAPRRRADGDEHRIGRTDGLLKRGGKRQPCFFDIGVHEIVQARLKNRNFATLERRDLRRILVDTNHVMAEIGQTGSGDETHITRADHCNAHESPSLTQQTSTGNNNLAARS